MKPPVEIFPKKKNCIFCGKNVKSFFINSYYQLTYDYKNVSNISKEGIQFRIYSNPYHIKCAMELIKDEKS